MSHLQTYSVDDLKLILSRKGELPLSSDDIQRKRRLIEETKNLFSQKGITDSDQIRTQIQKQLLQRSQLTERGTIQQQQGLERDQYQTIVKLRANLDTMQLKFQKLLSENTKRWVSEQPSDYRGETVGEVLEESEISLENAKNPRREFLKAYDQYYQDMDYLSNEADVFAEDYPKPYQKLESLYQKVIEARRILNLQQQRPDESFSTTLGREIVQANREAIEAGDWDTYLFPPPSENEIEKLLLPIIQSDQVKQMIRQITKLDIDDQKLAQMLLSDDIRIEVTQALNSIVAERLTESQLRKFSGSSIGMEALALLYRQLA